MKLSSYTILITYFIASLGYLSVYLVDGVGAPFVAATGALAASSLYFNLKGRKVVHDLLWNILAAAVLAFFLTDYFVLSGSLITAASRMLTLLLSLKLFGLGRNSDYLLVFSLVFFQILAAAASTVSLFFFLLLALFVLSGIWAMIMFTVRKDWQDSSRKELPAVEFGWPFFISVIVVSFVSIAVTLLLFFIIPRMGLGLMDRKTDNPLKVTGFSDRIDLGSIAPFKTDSTVIMRVEALNRRPGLIYLRGSAFDHYDGVSWSKKVKKDALVKRSPDGRFYLKAPGGMESRSLALKILLEPIDTDYIFTSTGAYAVEGNFSNLWAEASGALRLPAPPYSTIEYRVWSNPAPLNDAPASPQYLDTSYIDGTPEGVKIRELAGSIVGDEKDGLKKARAVEAYLRKNFRYTLNPKTDGKKPLEDFLFRSKEGFCEHYATAMAVMLRAAGIPSRVVNGYLQGQWSDLGGYFIVRQSDAHSWVEANIGGAWVTFDPTPPSGVTPAKPSRLFLYLDYMRLKWDRYIIQFSLADQGRLAQNIEGRASGLLAILKKPTGLFRSSTGRVVVIIVLSAAAVSVILSLRRIAGAKRRSKTPDFYIEMTRILKKRGIQRRPDETPLEFALRLNNREVSFITGAYHEQRYGGAGTDKDFMEEVKKTLEGLKNTRR
ncbi:MAG: DUF3488 domain-containing protein [Deltaproteobacteria bacterium]|nr:DUF3488 domain-containing protein [Deltaproteobacteria bacterium]